MAAGCGQLLGWLWLLCVGVWAQDDAIVAVTRSTLGLTQPGATAGCEHRQYPQAECFVGHLLWGSCESQHDPILQDDDPGACDYVCGFCLSPCPADTELTPTHLQRLVAGVDWAFDCQLCSAGKLDDDLDPFTVCSDCAAGTYKAEGAGACEPCSMHSVDDDANPATPCVPCPAGHVRVSSVQCQPCANGTHMANPLDPFCSPCPSGSVSGRGAADCTLCPAGRADLDSDPASPCQTCPPGDHADRGQVECLACVNFTSYELKDHDNNYITPKLCLPRPPEPEPEPEPELESQAPLPPPAPTDGDSASGDATGGGRDVSEPQPEPALQPEANETGVEVASSGSDTSTGSADQPERQWAGSWDEEVISASPATQRLRSGTVQAISAAAVGSVVCVCAAMLSRWWWQQRKGSKVYAIRSPTRGADGPPSHRGHLDMREHAGTGDPNDLLPAWMETGIDSGNDVGSPLQPTSGSPQSPQGAWISRREQALLERRAAEAREREAEAYRKVMQGRKAAVALYGPQAAKMWTPGGPSTRRGKRAF